MNVIRQLWIYQLCIRKMYLETNLKSLWPNPFFHIQFNEKLSRLFQMCRFPTSTGCNETYWRRINFHYVFAPLICKFSDEEVTLIHEKEKSGNVEPEQQSDSRVSSYAVRLMWIFECRPILAFIERYSLLLLQQSRMGLFDGYAELARPSTIQPSLSFPLFRWRALS